MKKILLSAACVASMFACGTPQTTVDGGVDAGADAGPVLADLSTDSNVKAFLEGKTLLMTGADIPSHPNGFNEDVNFGAATQCYNQTEIKVMGGNFNVSSRLATIQSLDGGSVGVGQVGSCDHVWNNMNPAAFTSNNILIQNTRGQAECFDVDATYTGFAQQGRGKISADQTTVTLELYFSNQFVNIRCADGAVGATGVKQVLANPDGGAGTQINFAGNAQQTYRIQ